MGVDVAGHRLLFVGALFTGLGLVQSTLLNHLSLWGTKPDLVLVLVVSWSLVRWVSEALYSGLIGGMALDLLSGLPFGTSTLPLLLVSAAVGLLEVNVFRTNFLLPLAAIAGATIGHHLLSLGLLRALGWPVPWTQALTRLLPAAVLLNGLAMPLLYELTRRLSRLGQPARDEPGQ